MKRIIYPALVVMAISLSAYTFIRSTNWKIKEDAYSVHFEGKGAHGSFKGLKADIQFDPANPGAAKISATIDATTVSTGFGMKNRHARSEEALNTYKYPTIGFTATSVTKSDKGYEAVGNLTIKGITKSIVLPFTFENNGSGQGIFKGSFAIAPKDYDLTRGGVPDKLKIDLSVPVSQ
jgi:polyisoprenoid-binding protein YceI